MPRSNILKPTTTVINEDATVPSAIPSTPNFNAAQNSQSSRAFSIAIAMNSQIKY